MLWPIREDRLEEMRWATHGREIECLTNSIFVQIDFFETKHKTSENERRIQVGVALDVTSTLIVFAVRAWFAWICRHRFGPLSVSTIWLEWQCERRWRIALAWIVRSKEDHSLNDLTWFLISGFDRLSSSIRCKADSKSLIRIRPLPSWSSVCTIFSISLILSSSWSIGFFRPKLNIDDQAIVMCVVFF